MKAKTDKNITQSIVNKRYSIRDNAINKSVIDTKMDIVTGKKNEENVVLDIKEVESKDISASFIEDSINTILYSASNNNDTFYKNLREPDFNGCQVKELEKGFNIVKESINPSKQKHKLWFDFNKIIEAYDEKDNFDAYILGVYYGMRSYTIEHITCLDKLFPLLKEHNLTSYNTFTEYCHNFKYTDKIDDIEVVNEGRYQKGLNDLLFNTKLLDEEN